MERWNDVDAMLERLFVGDDAALENALARSRADGLPPIAVSPLYGKLLGLLTTVSGARRVLEVGTLGGYSTIWLARALPEDGEIVTLEAKPEHARVARANLEEAGVSDLVRIVVGDADDALRDMVANDEGPFDLVFLDADKEGLVAYLDSAIALSRPGSLIIADNVVRDGAVLDDTDDPMIRGVQRFLERASQEPRLETTVLQTVGTKGYDGLAISRVVG